MDNENDNFIKKIRENYSKFNKNQKEIADFFLNGDLGISFLSTREIADNIGCSNASVVRFAQKLGYEGYEHMHKSMQNFFQNKQNPVKALEESVEVFKHKNDLWDMFLKSVKTDLNALEQLEKYITSENLSRAINLINEADKIFIFGIGIERSLAEFLAFRLKRFGLNACLLSRGSNEIYNDIYMFDKNSLIFTVGFFRFPPEINIVLDHANNVNADTILLTDDPVSPYNSNTSLTLSAPRGPVGIMHSMVVPMAILNGLILSLGTKKKYKNNLENLEKMRSQLSDSKQKNSRG